MKNIILIVLLLWSGVGVWAQDKLTDEKRKEFDAQKVAFFTQELDLSPAEAAVFWPLYNEMQKKNREIEADMRKSFHEVRNAKGLKEYYQKMIQVVPASKIWKLSDAERKFHRQLFDKLRRESCSQK